MERTQKLLSIALTVLALDGWGAVSAKPEEPTPSPSPRSSSHSTHRSHFGGFHHSTGVHAGIVAGAAGAAAAHIGRGGKHGRGGGKGSGGHGFGGAGAHGGGG